MKQKVLLLIVGFFFGSYSLMNAQSGPANNNCESPDFICINPNNIENVQNYDQPTGGAVCNLKLYYYFQIVAGPPVSFEIECMQGMEGYKLMGSVGSPINSPCQAFTGSAPLHSSASSPGSPVTNYTGIFISTPGFYYLEVDLTQCIGTVTLRKTGPGSFNCIEPEPPQNCDDCIGSFAPIPGKTYLLSAWVREENAPLDKITFNYPVINLEFLNSGGSIIPTTIGSLTASGQIIDGWQRIESEFEIPAASVKMNIKLSCQTNNCFFDDIRVFPFDGSMKSYVYDPVTLRLVAELDERNYATMYEYDEEGKLIRIKKETEKGIMTIQESKTSVIKE